MASLVASFGSACDGSALRLSELMIVSWAWESKCELVTLFSIGAWKDDLLEFGFVKVS